MAHVTHWELALLSDLGDVRREFVDTHHRLVERIAV
jgi:hypothetical protein